MTNVIPFEQFFVLNLLKKQDDDVVKLSDTEKRLLRKWILDKESHPAFDKAYNKRKLGKEINEIDDIIFYELAKRKSRKAAELIDW